MPALASQRAPRNCGEPPHAAARHGGHGDGVRCAEEVNAATAAELPHHQTQAGHQCQGRGGRELPIPGIPFPNLTTANKTRVGPGAGQGRA